MRSSIVKRPLIATGAILVFIIMLVAACTNTSAEVATLKEQIAKKDTEIFRLNSQDAARDKELAQVKSRVEQQKPVVQVGQLQPVPAGAQPSGWDTTESIRGGLKLVAMYDSSGPASAVWRYALVFSL